MLSFSPVIINFIYAMLGGALTLVFMWVGYKLFDVMTPFSIPDALSQDNRAVGFMVMGMFIFDRWEEWVPLTQRRNFALASYNAGLTRVHEIRKLAAQNGNDPDRWRAVAPYAPRETRNYVERVHLFMGRGGLLAPGDENTE